MGRIPLHPILIRIVLGIKTASFALKFQRKVNPQSYLRTGQKLSLLAEAGTGKNDLYGFSKLVTRCHRSGPLGFKPGESRRDQDAHDCIDELITMNMRIIQLLATALSPFEISEDISPTLSAVWLLSFKRVLSTYTSRE